MPKVELRGVSLGFGSGAARMMAINQLDLTLNPGVFTVISGPSGSGKTSLISIIGAMIAPDTGLVRIDDDDIAKFDLHRRSEFRRAKIGYVFQSFRLMPALNAEENVRLSLEIRRMPNTRSRALQALEVVGLAGKAALRPDQMSHGEKQRVAVARAIAHDPGIVLADEPTASLDAATGAQVTRLLLDIASGNDRIVAIVTHDPRILPAAQRIVRMEDGRIVEDQLCQH